MDNVTDKHPWLDFNLKLRNIHPKTWIKLGECLSKIEHIERVPLKPSVAAEMHLVYLVKGVQATTAIEGNTLTEEEVKLRIEKKLELPPSKEYLGTEIDNILKLCNEIKDFKIPTEKEHTIDCKEICRYNQIILEKVPLQEGVIPGEYRTYNVGVAKYRAPDSRKVPELMNKYCEWINSSYFNIDKNRPVLNSIIKAIIAHLYFAWIHPFGDGNGRTARIIEFYILLSSGVPSPVAHLLSNHYNATKSDYYKTLDATSRKNDVIGFIDYAVQGFLDGLKEQLKYIFKQVIDTSWESYIYESFRGQELTETTAKRRRSLMLELSKKKRPIPENELITLSPLIIEFYRKKTRRTLIRDIRYLEKMDMLKKTEKGYLARIEKILSLRPSKATK